MGTKSAPRIAARRAQRGAMLLILILLFSLPIIISAYLGFVVKPGLDLVQNKMTQHQADYAALSLRWECEEIPACSATNEDSGTANPQNWPAPYAHTPDSVSERLALSLLQFITLSGTAYAEDDSCQPPDCLSGTKEIREEGGKSKVYIQFESDRDIRNRNFNASAEATMEAGEGIESIDIDNTSRFMEIFDGFIGCDRVWIGGNSEVNTRVSTAGEFKLFGSAVINDRVVTDGDEFQIIGNNAKINGDIHLMVKESNNDIQGITQTNFSGDSGGGGIFTRSPGGGNSASGNVYVRGNLKTALQGHDATGLVIDNGSLFVQGGMTVRQNVEISDYLVVNNFLQVDGSGSTCPYTFNFSENPPRLNYNSCNDDRTNVSDPAFNCVNVDNICNEQTLDLSNIGFDIDEFRDVSICSDDDPDPLNFFDAFFEEHGDIDPWGDWTYVGTGQLTPSGGIVSDINGDHPRVSSRGYVKVNNFELKGNLTVANGIFTLHVAGNFVTTGNNARLHIRENARLIMIVEGDITINGGDISADNIFTDENQPQLMIISTGGDVSFSGNGLFKGLIYAPESVVTIRGTQQPRTSPKVSGAIFAQELDISGNANTGSFEYADELENLDSDLVNLDDIGGTDDPTKPFIVK